MPFSFQCTESTGRRAGHFVDLDLGTEVHNFGHWKEVGEEVPLGSCFSKWLASKDDLPETYGEQAIDWCEDHHNYQEEGLAVYGTVGAGADAGSGSGDVAGQDILLDGSVVAEDIAARESRRLEVQEAVGT